MRNVPGGRGKSRATPPVQAPRDELRALETRAAKLRDVGVGLSPANDRNVHTAALLLSAQALASLWRPEVTIERVGSRAPVGDDERERTLRRFVAQRLVECTQAVGLAGEGDGDAHAQKLRELMGRTSKRDAETLAHLTLRACGVAAKTAWNWVAEGAALLEKAPQRRSGPVVTRQGEWLPTHLEAARFVSDPDHATALIGAHPTRGMMTAEQHAAQRAAIEFYFSPDVRPLLDEQTEIVMALARGAVLVKSRSSL